MKDMKQLWSPYIGRQYKSSKIKLLLIGESHYSVDKNGDFDQVCYDDFIKDINTTKHIIDRVKNGEKWKFYINTERLLGISDRKRFWENVAFYNLIQEPMKTTGQRPTNQEFRESLSLVFPMIEKSFKDDLPTDVIFLGSSSEKFFGSEIKPFYNFLLETTFSEKIGRYWATEKKINYLNNQMNFYFIKHPSSYFSVSEWNKYLIRKRPELAKISE